MYNNSYYGNYRTRTFSDVWFSVDDFKTEYNASALKYNFTDATNVDKIFYLLYSEYGNSHIASEDENQFKYQIYATIFEYGPAWEKRLALQKQFRELQEADLLNSRVVYNKALNPETSPSTDSLEALSYINEQTATNYKRNKLDALTAQYNLIATDVTKEFINKFKRFFLQVVLPEKPLYYISDEEIE